MWQNKLYDDKIVFLIYSCFQVVMYCMMGNNKLASAYKEKLTGFTQI